MIPSSSLGQDELRAKSQQGLQAMKSGVESLRTVLANNPIEPRQGDHSHDSSSRTSTSRPGSRSSRQLSHPPLARSSIDAEALNQTATTATTTTSTTTTTTTTRARSGSWSFLPPSLSGKPSQGPTTHSATPSSSSTSTSTSTAAQHQHRPTGLTRTGSIADSVTESIKSLGTGLKLGQLAGGLGLTGGSGSTKTHSRRGTTDSLDQQQQHSSSSSLSLQDPPPRGPYLNGGGGGGGSLSRSRVWGWTGPETNNDEEPSDRGRMMMASSSSSSSSTDPSDTVIGKKMRPTETILRTGTKTRQAAHETETLLAKLRDQQDVAMERMRRMPQVEKMTQRYQDSWRDIHDHTARNSEKADDVEEILEKVLEICTRHINASVQLAEEAKDLKDLDKSMDEMVSMSENIRRKLIGLESKIQTLEENAEVMSLADWKKSQTLELDRYMEAKKNELWDKAEMLSTRSEQFQKEEAARKLHQYQNQFQTDMERFRRTQEERQQEWLSRHRALETPETTTTTTTTTFVDTMGSAHGLPSSGSAPRNGSKKRILRVPQETFPVELLSSEAVHEEEQRRDKEELDQFLGPATESDSKDDDDDDNEDDDDDEEEDEVEDAEDGTEDETELSEDGTDDEDEDGDEDDEDASDEDLDPIAKARKARAMAAAAAQKSDGANKVPGSGSTISAFSALGRHASPSTLSLSKS